MGFYQPIDANDQYQDHHTFDQHNFGISHNQGYMVDSGIVAQNTGQNFNPNNGIDHVGHQLFRNSSISSIDNKNNYSYSDESDMLDGFNRTQSVRLYPSNMSGAITSRQNSSYESGLIDDEEVKNTPRSVLSSGSHQSNRNYGSAHARTFASSGGQIDQHNSHPHLTYEMQNMNSSFDVGNDPLHDSFRLTPRHMSDYSFHSGGHYYEPQHLNSFQNYTKSQGGKY